LTEEPAQLKGVCGGGGDDDAVNDGTQLAMAIKQVVLTIVMSSETAREPRLWWQRGCWCQCPRWQGGAGMDDDGGDEAGGGLGSGDMGPVDLMLGLLVRLEEEQVMDTSQP
jgi:hypothetical protein